MQNRYSFADREWDYVVDHCERNGIAFIPWYPLGAGKVAGEVLTESPEHTFEPHPNSVGLAPSSVSHYVAHPGTSSIEHLEQNIAAASLRLADEEYESSRQFPSWPRRGERIVKLA